MGQTWSNAAGAINIDLDNLLSPKLNKSGQSLSMNQLKSQSPTKTTANLIQPTSAHINNNMTSMNNFSI